MSQCSNEASIRQWSQYKPMQLVWSNVANEASISQWKPMQLVWANVANEASINQWKPMQLVWANVAKEASISQWSQYKPAKQAKQAKQTNETNQTTCPCVYSVITSDEARSEVYTPIMTWPLRWSFGSGGYYWALGVLDRRSWRGAYEERRYPNMVVTTVTVAR